MGSNKKYKKVSQYNLQNPIHFSQQNKITFVLHIVFSHNSISSTNSEKSHIFLSVYKARLIIYLIDPSLIDETLQIPADVVSGVSL